MPRLDHIDLRVQNLEEVRSFYETLLPALGFDRDMQIEGWIQYERSDSAEGEFFGVTESATHVPNETRIAFRAVSQAEVNQLAQVVIAAGGRNIEGPGLEARDYYAVFFEDPSGNRLEICYRTTRTK